MTQIDDIYGAGFVRQWDFDATGRPGCFLDGLDSSDAGALAALQKNAAVRALVSAVEPYEAAQAIVAAGEPDNGQPKQIPDPAWVDPGDGSKAPQIANPAWALLPATVTTTDSTGAAQTVPEPRWTAYNAAQALVAGASAITVAHALWRAPEPSAAQATAFDAWQAAASTVEAALATLAAQPLTNDPRPVPATVAMWQAKAVLTEQDLLTAANNAVAAANSPVLSAFWTNATNIDRTSPTLAGIAAALNLSSAQVDSLFRAAAAITL